jgi:hypothetical protein
MQISGATERVLRGAPVLAANGLTTAQTSTASSFGPTWGISPGGTWVVPEGGRHPILRRQELEKRALQQPERLTARNVGGARRLSPGVEERPSR